MAPIVYSGNCIHVELSTYLHFTCAARWFGISTVLRFGDIKFNNILTFVTKIM